MIVQLPNGLAPASQMVPWLAPRLPRYTVGTTAGYTSISSGMWIQIMVRPHQQGAKLVDGMPLVPRLLMVLGFLGGILPGIIFSVIYFAVCSGTWKRMHGEIAGVLRGEVEAVGANAGMLAAGATASSSPMLSEKQTEAVKRYALPVVAGLLLLAAPGCALGAWESGKGASYAQGNLNCIEETRELTKKDLVWASAGQDPPADCPEKALAEKQNDTMCAWETKVSSSQCHSSSVSFSEPSRYGYGASRNSRVIQRGSEYWSLATPDTLQSRLSSLRRVEGTESSRRNTEVVWVLFYLLGAAGCAAGGATCLWQWFRQEKKRTEAPGEPSPA